MLQVLILFFVLCSLFFFLFSYSILFLKIIIIIIIRPDVTGGISSSRWFASSLSSCFFFLSSFVNIKQFGGFCFYSLVPFLSSITQPCFFFFFLFKVNRTYVTGASTPIHACSLLV
jgi:hypothetical protein